MACWERYRAPCIQHQSGCRQCGRTIENRLAYCSADCRDTFERNHFWGTASAHAIKLACPGGESHIRDERGHWVKQAPLCARCGKACGRFRHKREAEVNHKVPVNGTRPHFGCCHHQENLEVLCHDCHVDVTNEQRRQGLIGPPRTNEPASMPLFEGAA